MVPWSSAIRFAIRGTTALLAMQCATIAFAALSGPPQSFFVETIDRRHLFVMQSKVDLKEDDRRFVTLPTGEAVDLRRDFPASGLYEIGSFLPLWTVDWYGEDWWLIFSDDGRHCARINRFGGGGYGQGIAPSWAMRFYDRGREINSYSTVELVDYPTLMEFTTWDWHYAWCEDAERAMTGDSLSMLVSTTTHERYAFDLTTGRKTYEWRLWRYLDRSVRFGGPLLLAMLFGLGWPSIRRRRMRLASVERLRMDECSAVDLANPTNPLQFSLRSLFLGVAASAVYFSMFRRHADSAVMLALIVILMAPALLWTYIGRRVAAKPRTRIVRAAWWGLGGVLWSAAYFFSIFPFRHILGDYDVPQDVHRVVIRGIYAPVLWVLENTRIGWISYPIDQFLFYGL